MFKSIVSLVLIGSLAGVSFAEGEGVESEESLSERMNDYQKSVTDRGTVEN